MNSEIKFAIPFFAAVLLAGCAALSEVRVTPRIEQISFRPQAPPFCGRCENRALLATADGRLIIEVGQWGGNHRSWKRRRTVKQITQAQFADFRRRLEAYKPASDVVGHDVACVNYIHDQDGVIVEWINDGERRVRVFDFGCLDDRAMNEAIRSAPSALGL